MRVLSAMYRGRFVALLRAAYDRGDLRFQGSLLHLRDPAASPVGDDHACFGAGCGTSVAHSGALSLVRLGDAHPAPLCSFDRTGSPRLIVKCQTESLTWSRSSPSGDDRGGGLCVRRREGAGAADSSPRTPRRYHAEAYANSAFSRTTTPVATRRNGPSSHVRRIEHP